MTADHPRHTKNSGTYESSRKMKRVQCPLRMERKDSGLTTYFLPQISHPKLHRIAPTNNPIFDESDRKGPLKSNSSRTGESIKPVRRGQTLSLLYLPRQRHRFQDQGVQRTDVREPTKACNGEETPLCIVHWHQELNEPVRFMAR